MRPQLTIALLSIVFAAQACSSSTTTIVSAADAGEPPPADPDASDEPGDAASDSTAVLDASPDRHDSGKLPFGATCLADGDCDSNVCAPNDTGGPMWCSFRCTKTTQAEKCPVPLTPGTCNTHGYCRDQ